jgi:hypothetical protein
MDRYFLFELLARELALGVMVMVVCFVIVVHCLIIS